MASSIGVWKGRDQIIIAIDFGTTQSSVSYSCLSQNASWQIRRVRQWPGQEASREECKVPTSIWYDKSGEPRAYGARALSSETKLEAEIERWHLAEHFKLHLHPITLCANSDIEVPSLPPNRTVEEVIAHWFQYLYRHTRDFFWEREKNGRQRWNHLQAEINFVVSHPNAWGKLEQDCLRRAAVMGGLVPKEAAQERVHFVTEAEASVHFLIHNDSIDQLEIGTEFIVCDAGGSTVNTTLYTTAQISPILEITEKQASGCIQTGAVHVNQLALRFLRAQLSTVFSSDELLDLLQNAVEDFEHEAKRIFRKNGPTEAKIRVSRFPLNHPSIGLRSGYLYINNTQVEKFFIPSVNQVIQSVERQRRNQRVNRIMLFGGFGESPYLRDRFRDEFIGVDLTLANDPSSKVVSDGATLWYIQRSVTARAARFAYGTAVQRPYNTFDLRHKGRKIRRKGGNIVEGVWDEIVAKDQVLEEATERRRPLWTSYTRRDIDLSDMQIEIYALKTQNERPYFILDNNRNTGDEFERMCIIKADMTGMEKIMKAKWGIFPPGRSWRLHYEVVMLFGGTELKAYIAWKDESGEEHHGPAEIVPVGTRNRESKYDC